MYDGGQNRLLWRNLPAIGGLSVARRCSIGKMEECFERRWGPAGRLQDPYADRSPPQRDHDRLGGLALRPATGRSPGTDRCDAGELRRVRAGHADLNHARELPPFYRSKLEVAIVRPLVISGEANVVEVGTARRAAGFGSLRQRRRVDLAQGAPPSFPLRATRYALARMGTGVLSACWPRTPTGGLSALSARAC